MTNMKNQDILNLVNGGVLAASAHSLPVEHFYKWHKFRRAMEKQYMIIDKEQKAMMSECGIQPGKLHEATSEALERFDKVNARLLAEDVDIKLPAKIPFSYYKGVYDENKAVPIGGNPVDIFANMKVETAVLEYLFTDPDAEEGQE